MTAPRVLPYGVPTGLRDAVLAGGEPASAYDLMWAAVHFERRDVDTLTRVVCTVLPDPRTVVGTEAFRVWEHAHVGLGMLRGDVLVAAANYLATAVRDVPIDALRTALAGTA